MSEARFKRIIHRLVEALRARPLDAALCALLIGTAVYVILYPLFVAALPPITDLPFHGTATAIFRHYWDPDWQFKQQFTLHPLEAPYLTMYAVGALFALFLPVATATKASAAVMLALLPIGHAVLLRGMRKNALWAIASLALIWTNLSWWGFFNHVGALGLAAMATGFALLCLQDATLFRRLALGASLLAVLFTHVFRFPFALLAVLAAVMCSYPGWGRARALVLPVAPSVLLFAIWLGLRPLGMRAPINLGFEPKRLAEAWDHITQNFVGSDGQAEQSLYRELCWAVAICAALGLAFGIFERVRDAKGADGTGSRLDWRMPVFAGLLLGGYAVLYLALPMQIGSWWYVYPREAVSVAYMGLACAPSLPTSPWIRAAMVLVVAVFVGRIGFFAATQTHEFTLANEDFLAIKREAKMAPRLMYLVFDHGGSTRNVTPFIHLPAWIQAEKGGALSFHFVGLAHGWPIRYRSETPEVPPPFPERWEWTPQRYVHAIHGAWFDEFLIRTRRNPSYLFRSDPTVTQVAQHGTWWLFRRSNARHANQ